MIIFVFDQCVLSQEASKLQNRNKTFKKYLFHEIIWEAKVGILAILMPLEIKLCNISHFEVFQIPLDAQLLGL